jgi:hypothetical protein
MNSLDPLPASNIQHPMLHPSGIPLHLEGTDRIDTDYPSDPSLLIVSNTPDPEFSLFLSHQNIRTRDDTLVQPQNTEQIPTISPQISRIPQKVDAFPAPERKFWSQMSQTSVPKRLTVPPKP